MSMFALLGAGCRMLRRHKKAVLSFYLLNLMLAGMLVVPFMEIFQDSLGPGLYRDRMVGSLDYDWYALYRERSAGFASTFSPLVLGIGPLAHPLEMLLDLKMDRLPRMIMLLLLVYLVLSSYLTAATVGSLALDPEGTSLREFLRTGATFFGRFFRLTLLSLLLTWALSAWVGDPSRALVEELSRVVETDRAAFGWAVLRYPLLLGLLLTLNLVFDYARIQTAVDDRSSVLLAFLSALRFLRRSLVCALGFYLLILLIGVGWAGVYAALEYLLPQGAAWGIVGAFLLQQIFVLGRLGVKALFYSGQMCLYMDRRGTRAARAVPASY